jgi:hypothetical protein
MEKKRFLLRMNEDLYHLLEKWAADDLRSVNAQIEFLLTGAARAAGRVQPRAGRQGPPAQENGQRGA